MRLALIFALIAAPAFARDLPPKEPTYEKPKFEKPEPPGKPPRREEPETRTYTPVPKKPLPVSCPKLRCDYDANGKRRVSFTADVQPDMYYLGRKFCKSLPHEVVEISVCCLEQDGRYKILYSQAVSNKSHKKAREFCACVLELD